MSHVQFLPASTTPIHPAAEVLPRLHKDSPEFKAIVGSIAEAGIIEPLMVNRGRVVDGRERQAAVIVLGYELMPCIEVPDDQVASVILHTLASGSARRWRIRRAPMNAFPR